MTYTSPKYKKLAKPKAFLVIGNVNLGFDEILLKTLANYAKAHNAQVYHLGGICSETEKKMYEMRVRKVRTFETNYIQKVESLDKAAARFDRKNDIANYNKVVGSWQSLEARAEAEQKKLRDEAEGLLSAERRRVEVLVKYFPNMSFVINKEQYIDEAHLGDRNAGTSVKLSKHFALHSVMANGPKISSQPITDRAFAYMKTLKTSMVVPHPTPALRSFNREGLNKSWELYSTGALQYQDDANRPSEFHRAVNAPSAMMVFIDPTNGEYHPKRIFFDVISCKVGKIPRPAILDDGLAYTSAATWEVDSSDRASVTTDLHGPFEHRGVVAASRTLTEIHKAETFIDLGDMVDFISLCPHNANAPLHAENLRFADDEAAFKRLSSALADNPRIKEKVLIDSNHHEWCERMVAKLPFLKGILDLESIYKRVIPDWKAHIVKAGSDYTYYFGDLAFRHGHGNKGSLAAASKIWVKVLLGHWHVKNQVGRAGTVGAGAMLGPSYLQGDITAWTSCIASVTRSQGKSASNTKAVLHYDNKQVSRFEYRGDLYEVEWHKYLGE